MSNYNDFIKPITDQVKVPTCIKYGDVDRGYLYVLIFKNDDIVKIGEFINLAWRKYSNEFTEELRKEFGIECEKYRTGERKDIPSLRFRGEGKQAKLLMVDPE